MKLNSVTWGIIIGGFWFGPVMDFLALHVFGDWDRFIGILGLVAVDFALGYIKAIKYHKVKSFEIRRTLIKGALYVALVVGLVQFEKVADGKVINEIQEMTASFILTAFAVMELSSIIENVGALGLPVPKAVLRRFADFNSETGKYEPEDGKEETKKEKELEKVA